MRRRLVLVVGAAVAVLGSATVAPPASGAPAKKKPVVKAPAKKPAKVTTRPTTKGPAKPAAAGPTAVRWQLGPTGWSAQGGTPPACPSPLRLSPPVDLAKATAILYPGQTRGGNYKPHGGFRFDGTPNDGVQVKVPLAGSIVRGARYVAEGEVQYTFDIVHPCGIMIRVGHLLALPKDMQAIANRWPAATEDSRTSWVEPPVPVSAGQVVGTAVGIRGTANSFVDLGVYDLRQANATSRDPAWQALHANDRELGWHAVCWFDLLAPADAARVRSLPPGDPTSGKGSDFCR